MAGAVSIWEMTEAQLLAEVIDRCERRGIRWVHIDTPHHNKKRQNLTGFPDLFLCGRTRIAFRELKKQNGRMSSPQQTTWKYTLLAAGQDWDIWQPKDLESGRIDGELDGLCS
jgi:hypothetical protein